MTLIVKSCDAADEVWPLPGGVRLELARLGGVTIGRGTAEPGWCSSKHVRPIAGGASCEMIHVGVIVSGREAVRMAVGTEAELRPGDAFLVGAGHDAWVVGDEPCVSLDLIGGFADLALDRPN